MVQYLSEPVVQGQLPRWSLLLACVVAIAFMWDEAELDEFLTPCLKSWAVIRPWLRRAWWRLIAFGRYRQYRAVVRLAAADIAAIKREIAEGTEADRERSSGPDPHPDYPTRDVDWWDEA
jgi:hypothetical protein